MSATKLPEKQSLPTSIKTRSNINIGGINLTTMDFGVTNVGLSREILPTDSVKGHISTFVQLAPMVLPTMGRAKLYSRAFFVPYRFIWSKYEDFATGKAHDPNGVDTSVLPALSLDTFVNWFFEWSNAHVLPDIGYSTDIYEVVDDDVAYDFAVAFAVNTDSQSTLMSRHVRLTPYGRDVYSIMRSLGYVIPPCSTHAFSILSSGMSDEEKNPSAMPLLALVKVIRDYYCNPNYEYNTIDKLWFQYYNQIPSAYLPAIFEFIRYAWYQPDVFTGAWATPEVVGYTEDYYKALEIVRVVDSYSGSVDQVIGSRSPAYSSEQIDDSYSVTSYVSDNGTLTQQGINFLKGMRNIVMRQNAAGGRYIDQILSQYGIRIDENEARRAQFLGSAESSLNISRVDATAAGSDGSQTSMLGDFVGRGTMSGDGSFSFVNNKNDFGQLLILNHIIPETHYYQGVNPELFHKSKLQFWNGDLETAANAPIPYSSVYGQYDRYDLMRRDKNEGYLGSTFGFSANYWENKIGRDILSGDFLLGSRNTELESFHMFRKLANAGAEYDPDNRAVLSPEFQRMTDENCLSYRKIFNDQSNFNAHFIVHQIIDVNANRPCHSLGESLTAELREHGNDVGNPVSIRPNGQYF